MKRYIYTKERKTNRQGEFIRIFGKKCFSPESINLQSPAEALLKLNTYFRKIQNSYKTVTSCSFDVIQKVNLNSSGSKDFWLHITHMRRNITDLILIALFTFIFNTHQYQVKITLACGFCKILWIFWCACICSLYLLTKLENNIF